MKRVGSLRTAAVLLAALLELALIPTASHARELAREPITVLEEVGFATGMAFLSDGRLVLNEREGRIWVVQPEDLGESARLEGDPLAALPTSTAGEQGLLGVAVAPDETSAFVYISRPDGSANEVWRVPLDGEEPQAVVTGLPAAGIHNGGGVAFDSTGNLLVSGGDAAEEEHPQDPTVLGGKVYRFTPDGDIPDDNPFGDSAALSIGHRNMYGLAVDPQTGTPWVTENGPTSFDEINRIQPGGNYGWPLLSGPADGAETGEFPGTYHDPIVSYEDVIVPTGIAFPSSDVTGDLANDFFVAAYGEGSIHRITLDDSRTRALADEVILDTDEPVIALAWGPDGLYFSTPDSVGLLSLVQGGDNGSAGPGPSPTSAGPLRVDGKGRSPWLLVVPAVLVFAFVATRRRFSRHAREPGP